MDGLAIRIRTFDWKSCRPYGLNPGWAKHIRAWPSLAQPSPARLEHDIFQARSISSEIYFSRGMHPHTTDHSEDTCAIYFRRDLFLTNLFLTRSISNEEYVALRRDLFPTRSISNESISIEGTVYMLHASKETCVLRGAIQNLKF